MAYVLHNLIFRSSNPYLIFFHKALSLCKCSSSVWSVPSIVVLYHTIHRPNFESHSYGTDTNCKETKEISHNAVAETKHYPLTCIDCSAKLLCQEIQHCKVRSRTHILLCSMEGNAREPGKGMLTAADLLLLTEELEMGPTGTAMHSEIEDAIDCFL